MKFISKKEQVELERVYSDKYVEWQQNLSGKYIAIPKRMLLSDELTDGEILFYARLTILANNEGCLYHSNETLAEKLGCKVDNVKKYIRLLKKKKMLTTLTVSTYSRRIICLTPWNITDS